MLTLLLGFLLSAPQTQGQTHAAFDTQHAAWSKILKNHVAVQAPSPKFKYADLKKEPEAFQNYLAGLSGLERSVFEPWPDHDKMAFWINAYNAFTIKLILDFYPVKSIKDVGGLLSSPWKKKFFTLFGEEWNLDRIEKEIFKGDVDPRLHFAIFRGAVDSAPLRPEAYVGSQLTQQLESQTKKTLALPAFVNIIEKDKALKLSKIFKWHQKDFLKKDPSVLEFIYPYLSGNHPSLEDLKTFKIVHHEFSWKLNDL